MQTLRQVAGVALFNKDTCQEILYDPRVIYQGLAILVAGSAAAIAWALMEPASSH
jgi:hypothetical protein